MPVKEPVDQAQLTELSESAAPSKSEGTWVTAVLRITLLEVLEITAHKGEACAIRQQRVRTASIRLFLVRIFSPKDGPPPTC